MALTMAEEDDISPWDALLKCVRVASARVSWVDRQLAEAVERNDGEISKDIPEIRYWLAESRAERGFFLAASKNAISAGIAERMTRHAELEGALVSKAVISAVNSLDLDASQRKHALESAYASLMSGADSGVLELSGTVPRLVESVVSAHPDDASVQHRASQSVSEV